MSRPPISPVTALSVVTLFHCLACVNAAERAGPTSRPDCLSGPVQAFERFLGADWPPFREDAHGNGHFGQWRTDERGDPAYEYQMDQSRDPRAAYFVTGGKSCDHWHLIGNDRIAATAHNGGYVQLYDWTRGGKILNRSCPTERNYAGGFKFIQMPDRSFCTLWEHLPKDASQQRVFGVGYVTKTTSYSGLKVAERIEAPWGDDPALVSTTLVENGRATPLRVSVVEFWDVNLHPLTAAPIMTKGMRKAAQRRRAQLNRRFVMDAFWDEPLGALGIDLSAADTGKVPQRDEVSSADFHPKTVFLAALDPLPDGFSGFAVDQELFFGDGGIGREDPPGLRGAADGRLFTKRSALGGKAILALRRAVELKPGERVTWRYLYGYADRKETPELVKRYRQPKATARRPALQLVVPELPWLGRELLWHSYYLQAGCLYQDFYKTHFVDQGSAYGYLQGLSGAHRDFALFVLPMVYLRPDLAREMLRFSMRSQDHKTGALPYMHVGYGVVSGAVVHSKSSDLDLFFLWALAEYLAATRDLGFLNKTVPFYPPSANKAGTVLEHARTAFRHLTESVGLGPHGVIRCGTGDWNDVLIALSPSPVTTLRRGESSLNAGLATVALPALAGAIADEDRSFAKALREFAAGQARALKPLWTGDWVARGYVGQGDDMLGADRIFLDTQSFSVLGGVWDRPQMMRLFERIQTLCVTPQPAGALCLWPSRKGPLLKPGEDTNGGTWAAVDSWVAWAWSRLDPQAAWRFYLTTTLAAHAEAYPDIWYGVWSGPDSFNAHYHDRPGETFNFTATPMTDFPVMNMNRHSGPLLDAIKLAGIEPRDGLIVIDPRLPFDSFAIRLPLVGAAYLPRRHRGYYAPVVSGTFRFAVRCPSGLDPKGARLTVNGRKAAFTVDKEGLIRFSSPGTPGQRITWTIE